MGKQGAIHSIDTMIARGRVVEYEKAIKQQCEDAAEPSIALHDYALNNRPYQTIMLRFIELHDDLRALANQSDLRIEDLDAYLMNLSTPIRTQIDIAHIADFLVIGAEERGGLPVVVRKKVERMTGSSHVGRDIDPVYPKY